MQNGHKMVVHVCLFWNYPRLGCIPKQKRGRFFKLYDNWHCQSIKGNLKH